MKSFRSADFLVLGFGYDKIGGENIPLEKKLTVKVDFYKNL